MPPCRAHGGKVYVFGRSAAGTYVDTTSIYDPAAARDDVDGVLHEGAGYNGSFMTAAESSDYVIRVEVMRFSVD